MSEGRCEWSDLPASQCAHCGAAPGSGLCLDPTAPRRQTTAEPKHNGRTLERPHLPKTWGPSSDAGECRCGKPARDDVWLCDGCKARFLGTLHDLPALDDELAVTITRQRAAAATDLARSADTSLPWHELAAEARRTLHALLVSWVRFCGEEQVRGPEVDDPEDRIGSLAAWLATRIHGLALLDIGPEAVDEITDAAAECHRIVFWKRRNRVYLGSCGAVGEDEDGEPTEPCPGEVYADEGEPVGYCEECEQGVTVVIKRDQLEKDLDSRLYTAAEIARLSTYLGLDAPRDQVRRRVLYWHRHKRITSHGTNAAGEPMFRYGEVRSMLYAEYAKRAS
jgi:hypothetical protein